MSSMFTDCQKTTEDITKWLIEDGRGITLEGEYLGNNVKTLFKCNRFDHLPWLTNTGNIKRGKGCPQCARSGFDIKKSAWSYVLLFDGYIKYGITNNLSQRLWTHKHKNGAFTLVMSRFHHEGGIALEWERNVKRIHGGRYVTKEQCPDGWTETLPPSLLEDITK